MSFESHKPIRDRVEIVLDRLRPGLLADGGNLELIDLSEEGVVQIELQGACATCPAQAATVGQALEPALRHEVPEVTAIVPVSGDPTPLPGRSAPLR